MIKFEMNERVFDTITGYAGIVTGYAKYIEDEHLYFRVEQANDNGLRIEWIPENRLESSSDE